MRARWMIVAALAGIAGAAGAHAFEAAAPRTASITAPGGGSIDLSVTLAPWSGGAIECSTDSVLDIQAGDTVGVCYTVTNHTGRELDWHYLSAVFSGASYFFDTQRFPDNIWYQPVPDGQSASYTEAARTWTTTNLTATWTAQDAPPPEYSYDDTVPFDFIDLTASPTAIVLMSGGSSAAADAQMPFPFRFYEDAADDVLCVGFLGVIFVGQPGCDPFPHDSNFEDMPIAFSYKLIAPAWTVWNSTFSDGTVYADTQGVAPNRRFVVEWYAMTRGLPGPGITFEVIIDEATSEISFEYPSMAFDDGGDPSGDYGGDATVGIQRDGGEFDGTPHFTQYSWWESVLTDGKAIRWTPGAMPYSATATATAQIQVLAPAVTVAPASLSASAETGTSTTATLTIGNTGNTDLSWTIDETPAGTGFHIAAAYVPPHVASSFTSLARDADPRRDVLSGARTHSKSSFHAPTSPIGSSVPAYAIAYGPSGSRYVSLDAAAPQTLTDINTQVSLDPVQIGSFVDNDFMHEYLFSNGGCNDSTCYGFEFGYVEPNNNQGNYAAIGFGGYLAPTVVGEFWHGMKWDATTHTVFAVASTDGPPSQADLYSIDPHTGTPTWIAEIDAVGANGTKLLDIAIAPNGNMYGIDEWTDTLFAIDKTNGHVANIGPTGLNAGNYDLQSIDFDPSTGILYYAAFPIAPPQSGMYAVDLTSGAAQLVAPINGGTDALRAFSIAVPGGPCAHPGDVPWLTVDRAGGTTAAGAQDDVIVTLDAHGLSSGTYQAKLCVSNNTPFDSTVAVPVQFTVIADTLFVDGFDGG